MDPFEDVIISVINNYIKENKCSELSNAESELNLVKSTAQLLTISVLLSDGKAMNAELHFSDWGIRSSFTTQSAPHKAVLEFCQMIESLLPSFSIVYKNVKW